MASQAPGGDATQIGVPPKDLPDPSTPAPSSTFSEVHGSLRSLSIVGNFRDVTNFRVQYVDVNYSRVHLSIRSLIKPIIGPHVRRVAPISGNQVEARIDECARAIASQFLLALASALQRKLEIFGLVSDALTLFQGRRIEFSGQFPDFLAHMIETFGVFHTPEGYFDRVLFIANITWDEVDNNFDLPANEWLSKYDVLSQASGALKHTKAKLFDVNFQSTKTDPWWLIDNRIENYDPIVAAGGQDIEDEDVMTHELARFTTYSPFGPEVMTEHSDIASVIMLPDCFDSVAIRIPCMWRGPFEDRVPDILNAGIETVANNLHRPRRFIEIQHIEFDAPPASEAPATRKRRNPDSNETLDVKTPDVLMLEDPNCITTGMPEAEDGKMFYAREVHYLYDHSPFDSVKRTYLVDRVCAAINSSAFTTTS